MGFDQQLIHTCTIENPTAGSVNAYNNEVQAFDTPATGVRCRLVEKKEEIWSDELQESVVRTKYQMLFGPGATITERAKISLVTLEDATALSDTFEVVEVLARRGRSLRHVSARLERVQ